MNDLALRISRGSDCKSKKSIGFSPINIPVFNLKTADEKDDLFLKFANAATTDEQLPVLREIAYLYEDTFDSAITKFMVVVFFESEAKHPLKCFIARYVTKTSTIQETFTSILASEISARISIMPLNYKEFLNVVSQVATCIENFNVGVAAVKIVEYELATYLKKCLSYCLKLLKREPRILSPTEKNEIFNLTHLTLRLLLHIIQKGTEENTQKLVPIFTPIGTCLKDMMLDNDVPMDTKSVCGILYMSMYIIKNGPDSWLDILNPSACNESLLNLIEGVASQLCLCSALPTLVSVDKLETASLKGDPAILTLLSTILEIGERSSLESTVILGVARTVHQISKSLQKITVRTTGLKLVDSLVTFAWSHLEHYMDSVRHLTAQMLAIVVNYCAKLDREGDDSALSKLLSALKFLDTSRKSYYVTVTCLVSELGARRVLDTFPTLIQDVLQALGSQHIQASATTCLETLVSSHARCCSTEELQAQWLQPAVEVARASPDCSVISILENLLVTALKLDRDLVHYIIPYIKQSDESTSKPLDLKCVLMLLSVLRKSGASDKLPASGAEGGEEWRGLIGYKVLRQAAIDAVDEMRILSLSLIVESPKTTEAFTEGDLALVLWYLKYNINAQAPNFRQLTLSCMKKFMKRLEDSYKVIKRQKKCEEVNDKLEYYLRFVEQFRQQCFASLLAGAGASPARRHLALQLLLWGQQLRLDPYSAVWTHDYVEKLLLHLEDSYENNKAFALELLEDCPVDLLKNNTYSISIDLSDVLEQASSLKPTDCVSAAYKLDLITRKLPERILQYEDGSRWSEAGARSERARYALAALLLRRARLELAQSRRSVALAARAAPLYGTLHCLHHQLHRLPPQAIVSDSNWSTLVDNIIRTCIEVNDSVISVVNNTSPEGHLPMDSSGIILTDTGNSGGVILPDGRQVTSQMVLLCAWRSVKEVSLILGSISSRLTIKEEDGMTGTLHADQLMTMGMHFTKLLANTKHRGAFEQAYVGFTLLLARLWRCRDRSLHSLPRTWLQDMVHAITTGDRNHELCATRRSAGLPFMIQALVTTELQVQSNPTSFQWCMASLLELGGSDAGASAESRCHALNIVRALFRQSGLHDAVAPHVGRALLLALRGFERDTWPERNSSTLLLSALVVRVFGVSRTRGPGDPAPRNTMTGRIFFLRYPQLYDFMLAKLQEVNSSDSNQVLRPSLYPVLLLLGRLYPSSLEGTVSNLKLVSFVPHVVSCATSAALQARQLAARALAPLLSPHMYIPHIQSTFALLKPDIKRNYCHGLLLQLTRLLECRPEGLQLPHFSEEDTLPFCVENTLWILDQATAHIPCYLIADEYTKVLNMMAWKFPSLLREVTVPEILTRLDGAIFNSTTDTIAAGREIFLSNAVYLYFILLNKDIENSCNLIIKTLQHSCYEVVLSALNYLLILHDSLDEEKCKFQERLTTLANKTILDTLKENDKYLPTLRVVLGNKYLECQHKSLKILTLEGGTQKFIIEARIKRELRPTESILSHLLKCVKNEPANVTHMYLQSLLDFVTNLLDKNEIYAADMLDVVGVVFDYSSSDNNESIRTAVVRFIENNIQRIFDYDITGLSEKHRFEFRATVWCTIITLLEDDEYTIRQRITDTVSSYHAVTSRVLPSVCAQNIRNKIESEKHNVAIFALIALLDFKSVVVTNDGNDECRVFDQNEKYNTFLEETVWSSACADKIFKHYHHALSPVEHVTSLLDNPVYKGTFHKLCNDNVTLFKKFVEDDFISKKELLNPKIKVFFNKLNSIGFNRGVNFI